MNTWKIQCVLLILLGLATTLTTLAADPLPESDLTELKVYEYTYTDFNRAKRIVAELRRRGTYATYETDRIEGDLYFNRADYFQALKYYKRTMGSQEARRDQMLMKDMYRRLIPLYYTIGNLPNTNYYIQKMEQLAAETHDDAMRSIALFSRGIVDHKTGQAAAGYRQMREAIAMMKKTDYRVKFDHLFYDYTALIDCLMEDGRYKEALSALNELRQYFATTTDQSRHHIATLDSNRERDLLATGAVIYECLGEHAEADSFYRAFLVMGGISHYDYRCISPYLQKAGKYEEAIRLANERTAYLTVQGDTVGMEMLSVYRSLAEAYQQQGNMQQAANYFQRVTALQDSVRIAEEVSVMEELASKYELSEQQAETERRRSLLRFVILLSIAAVVVTASLTYCVHAHRYNRIIRHKNRLLAQRIDELVNAENTGETEDNVKTNANDTDRMLFERLHHEIVDNQLYLQADLSRDQLLQRLNIPKNDFARLFQKFTDTTYSKYINELRLNHALQLLRQHPNYTIESIAEESGFGSKSTLFVLFSQKYGMTPTEYRRTHAEDDGRQN